MMKYRVKVTETHSDIVIVEAENEKEALSKAWEEAECSYECAYDSEILESIGEE